jgi:hypothetical protein
MDVVGEGGVEAAARKWNERKVDDGRWMMEGG